MPCRLVELRSPCGPLDPFLKTQQRNFWLIYVPAGCPKREVLRVPKRLQLGEHARVPHPRSVRCQFYSASEALGSPPLSPSPAPRFGRAVPRPGRFGPGGLRLPRVVRRSQLQGCPAAEKGLSSPRRAGLQGCKQGT